MEELQAKQQAHIENNKQPFNQCERWKRQFKTKQSYKANHQSNQTGDQEWALLLDKNTYLQWVSHRLATKQTLAMTVARNGMAGVLQIPKQETWTAKQVTAIEETTL
jgi:hypothetical protein